MPRWIFFVVAWVPAWTNTVWGPRGRNKPARQSITPPVPALRLCTAVQHVPTMGWINIDVFQDR